jgi:hypothetical protein
MERFVTVLFILIICEEFNVFSSAPAFASTSWSNWSVSLFFYNCRTHALEYVHFILGIIINEIFISCGF